MLISVLVITYNHEKYIEKSLKSILDQEGDFRLEIIIGNDKSPDNTKKILKKYETDKRFLIINREINIGATKNMNDLIKKANGKYIAILEGDDFWTDPKKLQKQLKVFEENKDAVLCFTDSNTVNEKDEVIGQKIQGINKIRNLKELIMNRSGIATGTILYKNIFQKKINKDAEILFTSSNIVGDLPRFAYLIKFGIFYRLPEKTGSYRYITRGSTSFSSKSAIEQNVELEKVIVAIKKYYNSEYSFFINCYLNRRRKAHIKLLKKNGKNLNEYKKTLKIKDNLNLFLYNIFSPIDNLIHSLYRKKQKNYKII